MTEREKPAACYRDRNNGVRFTKSAHRIDCSDDQCRGCKPCLERWHCTAGRNCTWHVEHGDQTCGRCLAATRRHIRRIGDLSALMLPAAIGAGVNSEAAVLAGPAVDPRGWSERRVAMSMHLDTWQALERITEHQHTHAFAAMPDDDELHPYGVLTRWQMMLSEDYGHDLPARMSIAGAVDYLDRNLHRIAQDDEQDFPLLRREVKKCAQHLEAVLRNDERPDRGAPCPKCTNDEDGVGPRLRREYAHWCEDDDCQRLHFLNDGDDTWHCPRDAKHWWTQQGYADLLGERKKPA